MKKLSIFILGLIVFSSCSGDEENTAPTTPSLTYPSNNLVCVDNAITFQWNASTDAQNDVITYQIQIATDNAFTQNLITSTTTVASKTYTLSKGESYYWRVKATDSKDDSSEYSAVYNFYTESAGVTNHLPFAPVLASPALGSTQTSTSVSLNWTATDADATDVLTYDVYFGTTNPPTVKVASDITSNSFTAPANDSGDYYWKVVVKDGKGGTTVGQIWNFSKE